jgi:enoyl-CoA hydratase/carnithine racemase
MSDTIRLEIDADGIARITLDEPNSRANTLHRAVWEKLGAACAEIAKRGDVQGLIVRSAKPGIFIAGADLREIAELPQDDPEPTRALVRRGRDVLAALEALPFPTIAVIDGAALGGGFEVALACDSRIAGTNPKIKIGLPETKLGLIPGWGGTQRPSRLIGLVPACHLVCSGDALSSEEAQRVGLIDTVVESETLDNAALDRLAEMKRNQVWIVRRQWKKSPVRHSVVDLGPAIRMVKQQPTDQQLAARKALDVVTAGAGLALDEALKLEEAAFVPLVASENARRLIAGFLKR